MANETTFQPGDVVQLKSGGPLMTVYFTRKESNEETTVYCYFYKKDETLEKPSFSSVALKVVDMSTGQPTSATQSPNPEAGGAI